MFHKEGFKIILISIFIFGSIILLSEYLIDIFWIKKIMQCLSFTFLILILQFFRNPKRPIEKDTSKIISSVDGKIVVIEQVFEDEYFKDNRLMISVFMSPFNVHVTRYPIGGEITYSKYHKGKYLVAWHPKASQENERTTIVVKNDLFGEVMYRQIAGALANRIVNYAQVGQHVKQGTDAGFIKFGSRVDIFLPLNIDVKVALNQVVKGGIDTIAQIKK